MEAGINNDRNGKINCTVGIPGNFMKIRKSWLDQIMAVGMNDAVILAMPWNQLKQVFMFFGTDDEGFEGNSGKYWIGKYIMFVNGKKIEDHSTDDCRLVRQGRVK